MRKPKFLLVILILIGGLFSCRAADVETYTIGVINFSPTLESTFQGFKDGLAEAGYIEGEQVTFIYDGPVGDMAGLAAATQNILAQDVDLILSLMTPATLVVKQAASATDIPVIFAPVYNPVRSEVVDSLTSPGSNITGIRDGGYIPKLLEWHLKVAPDTRVIFVPYNSLDNAAVQSLEDLTAAAAELNVELITVDTQSTAELEVALEKVPAEVDAIMMLPSGFLVQHAAQYLAAGQALNIPAIAPGPFYKAGFFMSYGIDLYQIGKQASRLAVLVFSGTPARDLPVETGEFYLGFNLAYAQVIGFEIPEEFLKQADDIIYPE